MSIIPYEDYAPHICRSVAEAVWEYEAKNGKKPSAIFAEYKAHSALACSQGFTSTPNGFLWMNIPLKLSPGGDYAVHLVGDPVRIRLFTAHERRRYQNGGIL